MTRRRRRQPVPVSFALVVWVLLSSATRAADLRAALEVAIDGQTLAGQPVLLTLTVRNTGPDRFGYWCGGPGRYPPANRFVAVFVDPAGRQRRSRLSNGQYVEGSGGDIPIAPGEAVTFPAAAEPLPPGKWTLASVAGEQRGYVVGPGKAMTVTWPATEASPRLPLDVRDDPKAAAAFAEDLLRRVRREEPFARHVATEFEIPAVIDATVRDLGSDDADAAARAAKALFQLDPLPAGLGAVIKRCMTKRLATDAPGDLGYLTALAEREGSDDALDAVLAFVNARGDFPGEGDRRYRLQYLFGFTQPRAADALRAALKDPRLAFTAAVGLSGRHDPAALPVLLDVARFRGHMDRSMALARLADYWDAPEAVATLEQVAADPESSDADRGDARRALQSAKDAKARSTAPNPKPPG